MLSLQARLDQAEAALHSLAIGQSVVEVHDANGESVRYSPANINRLRLYIAELKAQMTGGAHTRGRRPLRPMFG